MLHFAANLSMLYPELPFLERFDAAARDGFKAVECLFPYEWPAAELRARLRANDLQLVLLNAPPGTGLSASADWAAGWRGTAAMLGCEAAFRQGAARALRLAEALHCPRIHCLAGTLPKSPGHLPAAQLLYRRNLRWVAAQAQGAGCDVLIEPINRRDVPGYFLNRQAHAHVIVQEVGADNLKVQMDLYHCQISEGDVTARIQRYLPTGRVAHFQIAGVPARHEPDEGELDYAHVFRVLSEVAASSGWQGWIGCEYRPRLGRSAGGTSRGLSWRTTLAPPPQDHA
ncbi:MAG: TIM barrel protein [Ottowia sp.]|nr:TIM barrel protein [Ottowia sp.]